MSNSDTRFAVNSPGVVHENFDGEVVIINLESGNYYSLEGSGAFVWDRISEGMDSQEIIQAAQDSYTDQTSAIDSAISAFITELASEDLIISANGADGDVPVATERLRDKMGSFEPPVLKRFTDMQELLLLDPIHEVDEGGWPAKKVEQESGA